MVETRRLNHLLEQIGGRVDLPDGDLVVALSGGADSAALAWFVTRSGRGVRFLHVDHGLDSSPRMRQAASAISSALGADLDVVEVELGPGPSLEGAARTARYRAFARAVPEPEILLTAHTRDDQAETVLMNLLRGAGLRGLSGIPPFRSPNIHRPFLGIDRGEAREVAALAGLPFLDDPMNLDVQLRRNVIRLEVMPSLRRFNPQITRSLARLAESARSDSDFLDRLADEVPVARGTSEVQLPAGALVAVDSVVSDRAIARAIRSIRGQGPSREELDRVSGVVAGESRAEQITPGITVAREGAMVVMSSGPSPSTQPEERALPVGSYLVCGLLIDVEERDEVCRVAPIGTSSAIFPAGTALTVVCPSPGEVEIRADGITAWHPGLKRHPVAFYQPGSTGYLLVSVTEEAGAWT